MDIDIYMGNRLPNRYSCHCECRPAARRLRAPPSRRRSVREIVESFGIGKMRAHLSASKAAIAGAPRHQPNPLRPAEDLLRSHLS